MKRILQLALIVLMIITFSSCGGNSDGDGGDVNKKGQTENQNDNQDKKTETEKKDEDLSYLGGTYREPYYKIVIDGPNWQGFFEAYSYLWNADSTYMIIFGTYKDYW